MLVGLHTHYQMHLASKFTLFFCNSTQLRRFTFKYSRFFIKTNTFYKKLPRFIKNYIGHTYKKLQPQISAFIKNSIFEINRDPCWGVFFLISGFLQGLTHSAVWQDEQQQEQCVYSCGVNPLSRNIWVWVRPVQREVWHKKQEGHTSLKSAQQKVKVKVLSKK